MKEFKALLVDDNKDLRSMLRAALERRFPYITFIEAKDGRDALQKLSADDKLVISDWMMPRMSGYELLESLRDSPQFKDIPFIMTTSIKDDESVIKAKKAGVTAYLTKPFSNGLLFEAITHIVDASYGRQFERVPANMPVNFHYDGHTAIGSTLNVCPGGFLGEFGSPKDGGLPLPKLNAAVVVGVRPNQHPREKIESIVRRVVNKGTHLQIAFQFTEPHVSLVYDS